MQNTKFEENSKEYKIIETKYTTLLSEKNSLTVQHEKVCSELEVMKEKLQDLEKQL